ncbi:MAG: class I SAM-dependent methyltransferase [Alphaproteobacteria bacterium]|nr:class I SAM-dependent methyltransferase [Alphaproteobacteria bacterium]
MFINNQDYLNAVDTLIKSNKNLENRTNLIKDEVLPFLRSHQHLLDVGIGCGTFTRQILPFFKKATLVEPEKEILQSFFYAGKTKLERVLSSIENISLSTSEYDLVVMSHVLYHIPESKRLNVIQKLYDATTEKGTIVIVYEDSLDRKALTMNFGGTCFNSEPILNFCKNNFSSVDVSTFENQICYDQLEDVHNVCRVYLHDAFITAEKNELSRWIKENLKDERDEKFYIKSTQYSIKIKKVN